MSKKILWKDAFQAITHSLGRFIAIFLLMALSAFTLIGLKMTGPDMRQAALNFYATHHLADTILTTNYGLNHSDRQTLATDKNIADYELGYFQDATVNQSITTLRIFSTPKKLSTYELVAGSFPKKTNEIALSYLLKTKYHLGQRIKLKNSDQLKRQTFKITGFVRSSEYLDKNDFGQTNIGTGQLNGYAIVPKQTFSGLPTIARITYKQANQLNPYQRLYSNKVAKYERILKQKLNHHRQTKYQAAKATLTASKEQLIQAKKQAIYLETSNPSQAKMLTAKIATKERQLTKQTQALKQLGYPEYTLHNREYNPGYALFRSNSERVGILANIFPILLFFIAALVSLTTMTRFVEEERINIGTFKALGYSDYDIQKKFILYSLISAGFGVTLGASLGFCILPKLIFKAYTTNLTLTNPKLLFSWSYLLITFIVALSCTTIAALWALRKTLAENPAQLLLPKAPKKGAHILLEKITFLWTRMSFTQKVTARNIFRYKSRMLMTIFGVAGCTGLLVMGLGIKDSLTGIGAIQYQELIKYNLVLVDKNVPTKKQTKELKNKLNSNSISAFTSVHYEVLTTNAGYDHSLQTISLISPSSQHSFKKFVTLRNRVDKHQLSLNAHSVIISEKLAKILGAHPGSTIVLQNSSDTKYRFKVTGITEMYMGHYLFIGKKAYQQALKKKFAPNAQLVNLKNPQSKNTQLISKNFMATGALTTISQNLNNQQTINNVIDGLGNIILILIAMATTLALVVIYNLTNINVSERIRELATIKVLGFYDHETTLYIYRETILLLLIGIGIGYLLGAYLHNFIITSLPPTNAMFDPNMYLTNFLFSALIPLTITIVLAGIMHLKIKAVDMLEALKSVD